MSGLAEESQAVQPAVDVVYGGVPDAGKAGLVESVGPALRTLVVVTSPQLGRQMPPPEDGPVSRVGDADGRCETKARQGVLIDQRSRYYLEATELLTKAPSGWPER